MTRKSFDQVGPFDNTKIGPNEEWDEVPVSSSRLKWKKAGNYAYLGSADLHDFAWEFLRRNVEFQRAVRDYWREPENNELLEAATRRWGLAGLCDPSRSFEEITPPWEHVVQAAFAWDAPPRSRGRGVPWPGFPDQLFLKFDLTLPLDGALKHAKAALEWCQKQAQKSGQIKVNTTIERAQKKKQLYIKYIRVLDAVEAGAETAQIAQVLFEEFDYGGLRKRGAQKARDRAQALAREGYRSFLLKPR